MEDVTPVHAKAHLEELVARAAQGEEVRNVDARLGKVRLAPAREPDVTAPRITDTMEPCVLLDRPRVADRLEGKMKVPARPMEPMTEEEPKDWYGDGA
jgi:antitoxin (DNA-binding transcriptional repressor) of toxin-antitoxin stability system